MKIRNFEIKVDWGSEDPESVNLELSGPDAEERYDAVVTVGRRAVLPRLRRDPMWPTWPEDWERPKEGDT